MYNIQDLIEKTLKYGEDVQDRTGVGTRKIFGEKLTWDMSDGFPAITTKKLFFLPVKGEFLWMARGLTSVEQLREITFGPGSTKKTIWDDNYENQGKALGYENGELGPVYGAQWRDFGGTGTDQLRHVINTIMANPTDRRMLVSAWNPADMHKMALPPCHCFFQFSVRHGFLDLLWYQRSVDIFLGLPFDIASYALMLHTVAKITGLKPGRLTFFGGDCHIYNNHRQQVEELLSREPFPLPKLEIKGNWTTFDEFLEQATVDDYQLVNYQHHPALKAPMAV